MRLDDLRDMTHEPSVSRWSTHRRVRQKDRERGREAKKGGVWKESGCTAICLGRLNDANATLNAGNTTVLCNLEAVRGVARLALEWWGALGNMKDLQEG